jgi:hypothetical protein
MKQPRFREPCARSSVFKTRVRVNGTQRLLRVKCLERLWRRAAGKGGVNDCDVLPRHCVGNDRLTAEFNLRTAQNGQSNERRSKLLALPHRTGIVAAEGCPIGAHQLRGHRAVMSAATPAANRNGLWNRSHDRRGKEDPQHHHQKRVGCYPPHGMGTTEHTPWDKKQQHNPQGLHKCYGSHGRIGGRLISSFRSH